MTAGSCACVCRSTYTHTVTWGGVNASCLPEEASVWDPSVLTWREKQVSLLHLGAHRSNRWISLFILVLRLISKHQPSKQHREIQLRQRGRMKETQKQLKLQRQLKKIKRRTELESNSSLLHVYLFDLFLFIWINTKTQTEIQPITAKHLLRACSEVSCRTMWQYYGIMQYLWSIWWLS